MQSSRGTVGINPRQLQKCQYPAMANSCSRSSCIFWERDAMLGPAGISHQLGGINAWLNPTKRAADPTDGHMGRAACGVKLRKIQFFWHFSSVWSLSILVLDLKAWAAPGSACMAAVLCYHDSHGSQGNPMLPAAGYMTPHTRKRWSNPSSGAGTHSRDMCHGTAIDAAWHHPLINRDWVWPSHPTPIKKNPYTHHTLTRVQESLRMLFPSPGRGMKPLFHAKWPFRLLKMPLAHWKLLWGKAEGGAITPGKCGKREMAVWDKGPATEYQPTSHHLPLVHTPHCVISPLFLGTETNS